MKEPSVLDFVKSKLMPWKFPRVELPAEAAPEGQVAVFPDASLADSTLHGSDFVPADERAGEGAITLPWRSLLAVFLALIAQFSLEPDPDRSWTLGVVLYVLAAAALLWSLWRGEWQSDSRASVDEASTPSTIYPVLVLHSYAFIAALILGLAAFFFFGGNRFNPLNLTLWISAIALLLYALWQSKPATPWSERLSKIRQNGIALHIRPWTLVMLTAVVLILFFRFYRLAEVPPEMNSDHAEKLLDVFDVLNGEYRIFFPRNTGREALQFYLTAGVAQLFGTGISFLSLKLGTALAGLVTLIYIYLLGKEIGNREVGLWAVLFAGISYWLNVITRISLRFSLYPLAAAPAIYYLVRGIQRSNRNDFILAGIALGIGLHGYSPARVLPLIFAFGVVLFLLHRQARGQRDLTLFHLSLTALFALFVFLPLLRYTLTDPDAVFFRAMTRLGELERPLPGPAWQIFLENLWTSLTMFFWSDGEIWLHSIPYRPALSVAAAALFFLGVVTLIWRYVRQHDWVDLFLLLSIPLLMLPSILSLAFPGENPSLNRSSGAIIPVFVILGIALNAFMNAFRKVWQAGGGRKLAWGAAVLLVFFSVSQDYQLVFDQYYRQYQLSSWNTSELGSVIQGFVASGGDPENAWVVPFPHWVDTRLIGMVAGYPSKDYALPFERLEESQQRSGVKLFLLKPEDLDALFSLRQLYPQGWVDEYDAKVEDKNFLIYHVPPQ